MIGEYFSIILAQLWSGYCSPLHLYISKLDNDLHNVNPIMSALMALTTLSSWSETAESVRFFLDELNDLDLTSLPPKRGPKTATITIT